MRSMNIEPPIPKDIIKVWKIGKKALHQVEVNHLYGVAMI